MYIPVAKKTVAKKQQGKIFKNNESKFDRDERGGEKGRERVSERGGERE